MPDPFLGTDLVPGTAVATGYGFLIKERERGQLLVIVLFVLVKDAKDYYQPQTTIQLMDRLRSDGQTRP